MAKITIKTLNQLRNTLEMSDYEYNIFGSSIATGRPPGFTSEMNSYLGKTFEAAPGGDGSFSARGWEFASWMILESE